MQARTKSLASRQQQLVEWIFHPEASVTLANEKTRDDLQKGIDIYRSNLQSTATRALLIAYPVITQLIGEDAIAYLAKRLINIDPPTTGDWGDWGHLLENVITLTPLAEDYAFLPDIARLEWAMHQSGRFDVQALDIRDFTLIESEQLLQSAINLSPAVQLIESEYPIDHIWLAHQKRGDTEALDMTGLARAIDRYPGKCQLLIYQNHQLPKLFRLSEPEYQWIRDVLDKNTITELLDKHPQFDFINWLTDAIEKNWISSLVKPEEQPKQNHALLNQDYFKEQQNV